MATITLGNIKFNWKGTYNAGTAYAIDDVVSYNGSSYIAKTATTGNLPTVTANWDLMSQKGTDADLMNITSTAQGDIYYNNGSAIARLGAGTNGQALITGGAGANPSWGTISSGNVFQARATANQSTNSTSFIDITDLTLNITPPSTSTKYLIIGITYANINNTHGWSMRVLRDSSVLYTQRNSYAIYQSSGGDHEQNIFMYVDSPNTTSQFTYHLEGRAYSSTNNCLWNDGDFSTLTAVEIG